MKGFCMKNIVLSFALLTSVVFAEEFQAKKYTWTYVVQAKDATSYGVMSKFSEELRNLIAEINQDSVRAGSVKIKKKFLLFVKEMQEAVAAGVNLFGSVSTAQEPFAVMVAEVAEQVVQEVVQEVVQSEQNDEQVNKSVEDEQVEAVAQDVVQESAPVIPAVAISFQFFIQDEEQQENGNVAIAAFEALAEKINNNSITAEELVNEFINVYQMLEKLKNSRLALSAF